jgi:hypothetical protein
VLTAYHGRQLMDTDPVRLYLLLAGNRWTWTPITDRWTARLAMRDFVDDPTWEGSRVIRALIVEVNE